MPRPKFLDQPAYFQRAPRVSESRADYASPVTRYDRARSRLADVGYGIALVAAVIATGVMLAWRG